MRRRLTLGTAAMAVTLTAATAPMAMATAPVATATAAAAPRGLPKAAFPLGVPGVPKAAGKSIRAGVDFLNITHGSSKDGYTVSLVSGGKDAFTQPLAQSLATSAQDAGFSPTLVKFTQPALADYPARDFWMVRLGSWTLKQKAKADATVKELKAAGISAKTDFLGDDGFVTTGPWSMRVLTIDPKSFRGSFASSLGKSTAKREKVTAMAKAAGAIAAINGGFFDIHTKPAYRGDPTGISVVGGKLLSEAVAGRTAIVLKGRTARITQLQSLMTATSGDGTRMEVTGVNRVAKPGELVMYTEEFGVATPKDGGSEVVINADGVITALRNPGAKVAKGTRVLHGVGAGADWLWAHAFEGWKMTVKTTLRDLQRKRTIGLTPDTYVVGGAIGLVRAGRTVITAKTDGMWNVNMITRRQPRTLVGVTKSGKLILAIVDGRKPGGSVGVSYLEAAQLMRWLGARDAVNLDGGGSSAMVVGKKVVNNPSDGGERAVGDALLIKP